MPKDVAQVIEVEIIIEPRIGELRDPPGTRARRLGNVVKFGAECILETAAKKNADLIVLVVRSVHGRVVAATHAAQAPPHTVSPSRLPSANNTRLTGSLRNVMRAA